MTLFRLAGLALLSIGLAGCIPRSRPEAPPPVEPDRQPERPDGPSRLPPDETRNRVAVLVPLSGTNAAMGQSILNAANLALFDTGGQRIRITAYDTSRGAAEAANEALADGNGLFLGPLLAEDVRAVAPIAGRNEVPVVTFSNDVTVAGDGVYVMGFNPGQSVDRVVAYARSRGATRFGALMPPGIYGQRGGQALTAAVEAHGGQLVGMEGYERTTAAIRAAATRLNARGRLDAVLIADGPQNAVQAVPVVRQSSPQPRILGTELWGAETNLGTNVGLRGAWFAAPSDSNFGPFRTRYRARYNRDPFRLASLGYDAVLLAVRIAGDWPVGRRFPERALRDPTGFVGVDGAFRFGRDGVAERALEVREVGASGTSIVSPAPRGFN
ncbi:penicillin-binding protein activator [Sphingosinicella terrae]|jgi:branched-chain amino acid transport system substrate-binding protein|uniref:penicillin-binding protein activator n=1 Tax=Sphingosinicella terrae TaxID=2172047 RepID=UPI000E0DCE75|nr:penicillin-binding protein activator [Sphingosinicella terrae]